MSQETMIRFRYLEGRNESTVMVNEFDDASVLACLLDPEKVVVPEERIEILFDYPMEHPVKVEFEQEGGFTRRQVLECIGRTYREIYALEDAAAGETLSNGSLINRGFSNGPYGIWGHGIGDLFLEGLLPLGEGRYELAVGS